MTSTSGLTWHDIVYDIPLPKAQRKEVVSNDAEKATGQKDPSAKDGHRRILRGISGSASQGEFLGILGSSGAGKTTLLNILSARVSKLGTISGQITYNGKERDPVNWKQSVGYVEQDDSMLPRSTVRETITYAAQLRLPDREFTKEQKQRAVHETIEMLRLDDCAETLVGGPITRGVSGGERKRTSIATELVSDVSLLFLDEPTSGLDAFAAESLVGNMSQVVKERNLACVMTIHQPSWAIFTKLDRVMLLAKGGVYYDGKPRDAIAYFKGQGYDVPEGMNPADYFISTTETGVESDERAKTTEALISNWKKEAASATHSLDQTSSVVPVTENGAKKNEGKRARSRWPTSWFGEMIILFTRVARETLRDKQTLYATIGQTIFLLILIGFAFFRLENKQSDVLAKVGVLFFVPITSSFSVSFPLIPPFPLQRGLMTRERSAGLYRTSSFFLAKSSWEIPLAIVQRMPYFVILYWMVGLNASAQRFFIFVAINLSQVSNAVAFGLCIGALSPTIEIANILGPILLVAFLLFGGTFVPAPPPWFVWLKWISPINYAFAALLQNEYAGTEVDCDTQTAGACYGTGDAVIESYNAGVFTVAENVGFLWAITTMFMLIGYAALRWAAAPRLRFK